MENLAESPQEIKPGELRLAAMDLLARREHLRSELAQKLKKRFSRRVAKAGADGPDLDEQIAQALAQLVEENLICDQRYTESYVRQRCARGYGPDRIRQELQNKGVSRDLIQETLWDAETDWAAVARDVREKKFGLALPGDFKEKSRQVRFLSYRGFAGEFAASALECDPDLD